MTVADLAELTKAPPTSTFKTLTTVISGFKTAGVLPPRIDKRFWPNMSGTVASQLVATLRFLGLIDDVGVPTNDLRDLVEASGTEAWQPALGKLLNRAYAPVMDVGLDSVHGSHLRDRFKEVFGIEGDPQRKSIAFFLFAARDAGIKLSPFLKLRERSANRGARKKRERPDGTKPLGDAGHGDEVPKRDAAGESVKHRNVSEHQMVIIEIINTYADLPDALRKTLLETVGFLATKGVTP